MATETKTHLACIPCRSVIRMGKMGMEAVSSSSLVPAAGAIVVRCPCHLAKMSKSEWTPLSVLVFPAYMLIYASSTPPLQHDGLLSRALWHIGFVRDTDHRSLVHARLDVIDCAKARSDLLPQLLLLRSRARGPARSPSALRRVPRQVR